MIYSIDLLQVHTVLDCGRLVAQKIELVGSLRRKGISEYVNIVGCMEGMI